MKTPLTLRRLALATLLLATLSSQPATAHAQGTAFTYQGRLNSEGSPVNGTYDLTFALFNTNTTGVPVAGPVTNSATVVTNGLFTTTVNFAPGVFTGTSNWLEVAVSTNGANGFFTLAPRQQLTPTPYAVYAESANAANLVGTIPAGNLSGVALLAGGNAFTGNQTINAGNVGIGTPASGYKLDIAYAGGSQGVHVAANAGGYAAVDIDAPNADAVVQFENAGAFKWGIGNVHTANSFQLVDYSTGLTRMCVQNGTGNVGFGTTTPANKLDVQGSADFTGNVGIGTTSPTAHLTLGGETTQFPTALMIMPTGFAGSRRAGLALDNWSLVQDVQGNGTKDFAFYDTAAASQRLYIGTNGNVGIGTVLPLSKFHVVASQYGAQPVAIFEVQNCGAPCAQQDYQENIRLLNSNGNGQSGISFLTSGSSTINTVPTVWIGTGYGSTANDLKFSTQTGGALVDRVYINGGNGNVGVGTTTPANKLDVQGSADFSGNVGIGTTTPGAKLQVAGSGFFGSDSGFLPSSVGAGVRVFKDASSGAGAIFAYDYGASSPLDLALQQAGGSVGIGGAPTHAKLDIEGATGSTTVHGGDPYFNAVSGPFLLPITSTANQTASLYASGDIITKGSFISSSDERIKHVIARSDAGHDLATILRIEVTDYTYIDTLSKGNRPQKKVIAQQVEKVYPQAVSQSTNEVPDIYKLARVQDGWVELATDLKVGERVKLIGEKEQGIHQVLEVRQGAFRTNFKPATDKVFVYGREVGDFRTVDYDAIAMLNVSATQELARKVEAQQTALTRLQDKLNQTLAEKETLLKLLAALEARDQAREDRLARLESSLDKGSVHGSYASVKQH